MSHTKGRLVRLWEALDPDLRLMGLIPKAWQQGAITLWGRRRGHAMLEPIKEYRGLDIDWDGGPAKETLKNAVGVTFCCSRRPNACHGWR